MDKGTTHSPPAAPERRGAWATLDDPTTYFDECPVQDVVADLTHQWRGLVVDPGELLWVLRQDVTNLRVAKIAGSIS
jgi:hypothetical protein